RPSGPRQGRDPRLAGEDVGQLRQGEVVPHPRRRQRRRLRRDARAVQGRPGGLEEGRGGLSAGLPPVRIDAENESAWCGERRLPLTPRVFAVLRYLVQHPRRLITKDDLLATVWRDVIVSDAALASCIRDLRRALGDSSRGPRYIETVHRRGF